MRDKPIPALPPTCEQRDLERRFYRRMVRDMILIGLFFGGFVIVATFVMINALVRSGVPS